MYMPSSGVATIEVRCGRIPERCRRKVESKFAASPNMQAETSKHNVDSLKSRAELVEYHKFLGRASRQKARKH